MRTYTKKYELGQQVGSWIITDWIPSKGNYVLTCSCGHVSQGSASFVDNKFDLFYKNGHTSCALCTGARRRNLTTEDQKLLRVFNKYKKSARIRNLEFSLTLEQCLILYKSACFYCGDSPENIETDTRVEYQGIDRINNNLGYVSENVIPCCAFCNYAKRAYSQEKFLEKVEKIHKNVQRLGVSRTQKSGEMVGSLPDAIIGGM